MADPESGGSSTAKPAGCKLQLLFLKDLSFEAPNVPAVLFGHEQPELQYSIETHHELRGKDAFEVVLEVAVRAVGGGKTLFLVEVKQGGIFEMSGLTSDEMMVMLKTRAPEALYPYVRELVASLVSRGGFPRFQLPALDFARLFAEQHLERKRATPPVA